jgi:hypothetical protein
MKAACFARTRIPIVPTTGIPRPMARRRAPIIHEKQAGFDLQRQSQSLAFSAPEQSVEDLGPNRLGERPDHDPGW